MVAAGPVRAVGGNMSRIMSVAAAVMGDATARVAATWVAAAWVAAAWVAAAGVAAAATATAALRERDIGSAKRPSKCNPERTETCGKSQDDEVFTDRTHDVSFP